MTDHPPELVEARRNIALGKLDAYRRECRRLAGLADRGVVDRVTAADILVEAADANFLPDIFGDEIITCILANALAAPDCVEVAE